MKKASVVTLLATLILALLLPNGSVFAGSKNEPKKTPTPPKHTVISSVSADSITINAADNTKTYKITKDTVIEFKGQKAQITDLQPGMRVSVSTSSDPATASRISASEPPKEPTKK